MSTENDVPLGEGARQYYEQQFGARIRQVKKGGGQPSGGSSGNWGKGGCGTIVLVFIGIRVIAALFRSSGPSSQSYHYNPPPLPPMQQPMQLDELFVNPPNARLGLPEEADPHLSNANDVPLLQGLCYRIYQESRRPEPSLGRLMVKRLDPEMRDWLIDVARGKELGDVERLFLLTTLDLTRSEANFWQAKELLEVPVIKDFARTRKEPFPLFLSMRERRRILELCYPRQIVPLTERDTLDDAGRARWQKIAQADLEAARKQYERAKH